MWITSKQLVKMLLEFSDDSISQAEIFTIFYGRTVDVPNMHLAHRVMTPDGWALLRQRFGDLFLFSPFRPEGFYSLNLELCKDRLLASLLIKCASQDGNCRKDILFEERFNGMGFESDTWAIEGVATRGRYEVTYCPPREPDMQGRKNVAEKWLGWDFRSQSGTVHDTA